MSLPAGNPEIEYSSPLSMLPDLPRQFIIKNTFVDAAESEPNSLLGSESGSPRRARSWPASPRKCESHETGFDFEGSTGSCDGEELDELLEELQHFRSRSLSPEGSMFERHVGDDASPPQSSMLPPLIAEDDCHLGFYMPLPAAPQLPKNSPIAVSLGEMPPASLQPAGQASRHTPPRPAAQEHRPLLFVPPPPPMCPPAPVLGDAPMPPPPAAAPVAAARSRLVVSLGDDAPPPPTAAPSAVADAKTPSPRRLVVALGDAPPSTPRALPSVPRASRSASVPPPQPNTGSEASARRAVVALGDAPPAVCSLTAPLGSPGCPTQGSRQHSQGQCRPCAHAFTKGCLNSVDCQFCHLCPPGELKRRQRELRVAQAKQRDLERGLDPDDPGRRRGCRRA